MMPALRDRFCQKSDRIAHLSDQIAQIGTTTRTAAHFTAKNNPHAHRHANTATDELLKVVNKLQHIH